MEFAALFFTVCLLTVSILLIALTRDHIRRAREKNWRPSPHQESMKELRRRQRQRDKIWCKIEDLHADLMKTFVSEERPSSAAQPAPQTSETAVRAGGERDLSLADVEEAYELFRSRRAMAVNMTTDEGRPAHNSVPQPPPSQGFKKL